MLKFHLASIPGMALLAIAVAAMAQTKDEAVVVDSVDAVVTVVEVNRDARTVTLRGPKGNVEEVAVPPEAQNLDQVQPGNRFHVRYLASVAVAIRKGGAASSSSGRTVKTAAKGETPGGVVMNMRQVAGIIESIDYGTRVVSVSGPEGRVRSFTVDDAVQGLEALEKGDTISVEYTESVALNMIREK